MRNNLDLRYIAELVTYAKVKDCNAFAELYAATSEMQYAFACSYLKDQALALEALQETYVFALKNIQKLSDPTLFIAWLNQINMKMCFRKQMQKDTHDALTEGAGIQSKQIDPENKTLIIRGERFFVRQIMTLPFTESQVLLLRFLCDMKPNEISKLLVIPKSEIHRCIDRGFDRLSSVPSGKEAARP